MKNLTNIEKHVTVNELGDILLSVETVYGMPIISYAEQTTQPKVTVKDRNNHERKNHFSQILKNSFVSILLNTDYQRGIEIQLTKEQKDIEEYQRGKDTMPLEFGDNNRFIGTFNDNFVLVYRPNENSYPKTKYFCDGIETPKSEIEGFLPLPNKPTNQGTEKVMLWRKVYLKNFESITFNGTKYILIK